MDELIKRVRTLPEEGEYVNPYADILPGDTAAPIHSLAMSFQEASRSRLGDFYEIHGRSGLIVLLRGELQVLLEGMPLSLAAGQAFFHLPFQTHFFVRESPEALICSINFEAAPGAGASPALSGCVFEMPPGWQKRYRDIIEHWQAGRGTSAAEALHGQLLSIASWAAEHPLTDRSSPWLETLMELTQKPEHLRLRVKEIAGMLNLAPNYLTAAFKTMFGVPLGSWLEHRRFGMALSMLAHEDRLIKDIAEETGFLSPAAFSRKMRGWCGLPPAQCREVLHSTQPRIRFTRFGQTISPNQ